MLHDVSENLQIKIIRFYFYWNNTLLNRQTAKYLGILAVGLE